ncbi:MAG: sodium:calcium antiporter [Streptosporangiales bacterium]|nr:sodium:calcium antiporter [Streptosporangiales bacterium]
MATICRVVVSSLLLVLSFALLLGGAYLFTNAVEWAGARLNLGRGATGSILAAVATALPESLIPVVAIISGEEGGQVAIGAVIGAPFLLGTLALALVGVSAYVFRGRRQQGAVIQAGRVSTERDLVVFMIFLAIALVLGLVPIRPLHIAAAVVFVVAYAAYAWRTIAASRGDEEGEELHDLFFDPSKHDPPHNAQIVLQVVVGLGLIVGGAHLFVHEVEAIAHTIGVSALVLALVLAPLASELPEKFNSFLWVRGGKDTLALGNITGAMVFQSMLPVAVGMAFTTWELAAAPTVAAACALAGGALCLLAVHRGGRFSVPFVSTWAAFYLGATAYIIIAT